MQQHKKIKKKPPKSFGQLLSGEDENNISTVKNA